MHKSFIYKYIIDIHAFFIKQDHVNINKEILKNIRDRVIAKLNQENIPRKKTWKKDSTTFEKRV